MLSYAWILIGRPIAKGLYKASTRGGRGKRGGKILKEVLWGVLWRDLRQIKAKVLVMSASSGA